MFMPTKQIIDEVNKGDARPADDPPSTQWYGRGGFALGREKADENAKRHRLGYRHTMQDAPPIPIVHDPAGDPGFSLYGKQPSPWRKFSGPTMIDGHHRLAEAEARGMQELAVEHYETPGEYKGMAR